MNKLFLIAIFLVVVFLIVRWQGKQANDFIAQSNKTTGVIIKKEERQMRSDQPQRKEYIISYSYRVDDKEYIGSDSFEFKELWSEVKEGQTVEICYLKTDPSQSHICILLKIQTEKAFSK